MSFIIKCDWCGKTVDSPQGETPVTNGKRWYWRDEKGIRQHACCLRCCQKLGGEIVPADAPTTPIPDKQSMN